MSTFRRGFKSWCENASAQFRVSLGIVPHGRLPAVRLAEHVGACVLELGQVPGLSRTALRQLTERDPDSWSAVTISAFSRHVIVVNPRSPARVENDLMHECSHLILKHRAANAILSPDGQLLMSAYDRQQEDEANWLAPTLLLPRSALLSIVQNSQDLAASARYYGVSETLLRMRINTTGVAIQASRRRA